MVSLVPLLEINWSLVRDSWLSWKNNIEVNLNRMLYKTEIIILLFIIYRLSYFRTRKMMMGVLSFNETLNHFYSETIPNSSKAKCIIYRWNILQFLAKLVVGLRKIHSLHITIIFLNNKVTKYVNFIQSTLKKISDEINIIVKPMHKVSTSL